MLIFDIIFTAEKLQIHGIHGIYIMYALKHIVFGFLVKKYFVTLQLIHKHRLNRHNISNFLSI